MEATETLGWIDWTVVAIYFVAIAGIGLWFARQQASSDDYFVGGRNVPGWAAGISLFGGSISTATLLAFPAHGFGGDSTRLLPGIMLLPVAIYTTLLIIPLYRNLVKVSAYEYLERRFGYPARAYAAFTYLSVQLFRMALILFLMSGAIHVMTGWDIRAIIVTCGLVTIVYTTLGGVRAVIWTDVLQSGVLLIAGLFCVGILLFMPEGGPTHSLAIAWEASKFKLADLSLDMTQATILVMILYGVVQYADIYTTAQTSVQRYLVVPSTRQAQEGVWIGNIGCVFTWTLFLLVGVLLYSYSQIHPEQLPAAVVADPMRVFPYFILTQLPGGMVGLLLAAMCAAAMSSLDSVMNAMSLTTVHDFILRFHKGAGTRRQLFLAKVVSCFWGLAGTVTAFALIGVREALDFSFTVFSILAGGVFGMFLLGFFVRRAHALGIYVGLAAGTAMSVWAALDNLGTAGFPVPAVMENHPFPVHVFLTATCSNLTSFVVGYIASLLLPDVTKRNSTGLTFWDTLHFSMNSPPKKEML